jgi:hypothetical protein
MLTLRTRRLDLMGLLGVGAVAAVWEVAPVPFRLRSDAERQALTDAFGRLLNSISGSLQVTAIGLPFRTAPLGSTATSIAAAQARHIAELGAKSGAQVRRVFVTAQTDRAETVEQGLRRLDPHPRRLDADQVAELLGHLLDPLATPPGRDPWLWACPESARERQLEIELGCSLHRVFFAAGYPAQVEPGWFSPLLDLPAPGVVSLHAHPIAAEAAGQLLRGRASELESGLRIAGRRGARADALDAAALEDTERLEAELARAEQRLFRVGVYLGLRADRLGQLGQAEQKLRATASASLLGLRPARFQMLDGLRSALPIGSDRLLRHVALPTQAAASLFPFAGSGILQPRGVLLGVDTDSGAPVVVDRFSLDNHNSVVLARSGAGKSFFTKLEVARSVERDVQTFVIDPEGEYVRLCREMCGLSVDDSTLDRRDLHEPLLVINLRAVESDRKAAAMYKALELVWGYACSEPVGPRLLVIDEAWHLLGDHRFLGLVVEVAKTARKRGLGLALVSQDLGDLLRHPEAETVVTNAALQVLLRQSPQSIERVAAAFGLSEGERSLLLTCPQGEGVLSAGGHRVAFRAVACPEEEPLLQTGLEGGDARSS